MSSYSPSAEPPLITTQVRYNPHIDLISHLHVIYILFTRKWDLKFLVKGSQHYLGHFKLRGI